MNQGTRTADRAVEDVLRQDDAQLEEMIRDVRGPEPDRPPAPVLVPPVTPGRPSPREVQPLARWRLRQAWAQRDLAKHSGVQQSMISRIESGAQKKLTPSTARALSTALGVQPKQVSEFVSAFNL